MVHRLKIGDIWISPYTKYIYPIKEETKPGKMRPSCTDGDPVLVTAKSSTYFTSHKTTDRHRTIPLKNYQKNISQMWRNELCPRSHSFIWWTSSLSETN